MTDLRFVRAGLERSGPRADETSITIQAATPAGTLRRIELTERQALKAAADLIDAVLVIQRGGGS